MKLCRIIGHKTVEYDTNSAATGRHMVAYKCTRCSEKHNDIRWFSDTLWADVWDDWGIAITVITIALLSLITITAVTSLISRATCNQYSLLDINTKYNLLTGCMAQHHKFGWLPISDYFRTVNLYQ